MGGAADPAARQAFQLRAALPAHLVREVPRDQRGPTRHPQADIGRPALREVCACAAAELSVAAVPFVLVRDAPHYASTGTRAGRPREALSPGRRRQENVSMGDVLDNGRTGITSPASGINSYV